jgi:hypothetical protein
VQCGAQVPEARDAECRDAECRVTGGAGWRAVPGGWRCWVPGGGRCRVAGGAGCRAVLGAGGRVSGAVWVREPGGRGAGRGRCVLALIMVACKRLHWRFSNKNQRKDDSPPPAGGGGAGTGGRVSG